MTRILGELLGASQPQFSGLIRRLERAAGRPSADIRLTHEVAATLRDMARTLHLDSSESTNHELYAALQVRIHDDEKRILDGLSVHNAQDIELLLWSIQRFVQKQVAHHPVLALKPAVMKRIIQSQTPKKTMRALGYRSVPSMIKHESQASLLSAMHLSESPAWLKKFHKQYETLGPTDFELRDIIVHQPRGQRWKHLGTQASVSKRQNILSFPEVGVVTILPMPQYVQGLATTNIVMALQMCNSVFALSTYMKLQQMTANFGVEVEKIASTDNAMLWLGDQDVSWQTLHAYLAAQPEVHYFDPYIQPEDLYRIPTEKTLETLHPALSFWAEIHHGLRKDVSGLLSCNILDVAINYCNTLSYAEGVVWNAQRSLQHELFSKYLNPRTIEQQLLPVLQPVPQEIENTEIR